MCFSMMWQSSSLSWWGEGNISSPLCPDVPTIRSHFKTGTSSMADLIAAEIEKKGAITWYYPSVIARASSQWRERENATFYSSSPSQCNIHSSTYPSILPSMQKLVGIHPGLVNSPSQNTHHNIHYPLNLDVFVFFNDWNKNREIIFTIKILYSSQQAQKEPNLVITCLEALLELQRMSPVTVCEWKHSEFNVFIDLCCFPQKLDFEGQNYRFCGIMGILYV